MSIKRGTLLRALSWLFSPPLPLSPSPSLYRNVAFAFALLTATPALPAAAQRNVVLMLADDQGLDAGCYGNKVIQTPNLDKLAAGGTRFEFAFCTTSSCSPSRSVILTGLMNHANGQYGLQHATHNFHTFDSIRGLPVLLHQAGYRTCSIGKFHVQPEPVYHFDEYANAGPNNIVQQVKNAEKFIRESGDRPFFVYLCTGEAHRMNKTGFGNERDIPGVRPVRYDPKAIPVPYFLPDSPEVRKDMAEYYQAVSRADAGLGLLMEALRETGHLDDTLVMYLSDNGLPFPGAKTTLYEPGMRLPLVVRSPDQEQRGVVCDALVTWADLTPTILAYTGAKGPAYPLHGRSLLPVLEQEHTSGWDEIYASHTFHEVTMYYPMRVVRTRRYKLIMNLAHELSYPFASDLYGSPSWQDVLKRNQRMLGARTLEAFLHRPRFELYDLESDPQEVVNLADRPEQAVLVAELKQKLHDWQARTKDPWLIKYKHE